MDKQALKKDEFDILKRVNKAILTCVGEVQYELDWLNEVYCTSQESTRRHQGRYLDLPYTN